MCERLTLSLEGALVPSVNLTLTGLDAGPSSTPSDRTCHIHRISTAQAHNKGRIWWGSSEHLHTWMEMPVAGVVIGGVAGVETSWLAIMLALSSGS